MKLLENTAINKHAIKFQDGKQLHYGPIYSLELVELEILKTYIKIYLLTRFIQPFKSSAVALILFKKKSDSSLRLCVNYYGLNYQIIKNWYLLPLISEFLNQLSHAKKFT